MYQGLGNNQHRTYAGVSNGKIIIRPGKDQEPILFDHIEGYIKDIKKSDRTVKNKPTTFIDITLSDGKGEEAVLSLYADSGSTRTLLLALGSVNDFNQKVRINAFPRVAEGGTVYTNVALRINGEKVPWCTEPSLIPKVTKEVYKGQDIIDASERNAFYDKLLLDIQKQLAASLASGENNVVDYDEADGGEPSPEDMPDM